MSSRRPSERGSGGGPSASRKAGSGRDGSILSLERGLAVLRAFQPALGPMSVPEVAARTGLPRQTANRLVHSLVSLGCLERREADGRYQAGRRLVDAGRSLLMNLPIRGIARPIMQRIASAHDTFVGLGVAHELDMIYIEYCASASTVTFRLRVGSSIPMAMTAMGRAYLWALPPAGRRPLMNRIRREAGKNAPAVIASIERSLRELDTRGYCATFPSARQDICGVGAPIVFNRGDTVLAMNCGAARLGLDERRFRDECGPALLRAASELADAVGAKEAEYFGVAESLGSR
jgi:DNA-binding IclR family transcriptional regulator